MQKNLAKFNFQSDGAGTKFRKLGRIKDMMIPLPNVPEQARIAYELTTLAVETQRLRRLSEQKQVALAALKKSLLHHAFTAKF